jgi:hypothetical protein
MRELDGLDIYGQAPPRYFSFDDTKVVGREVMELFNGKSYEPEVSPVQVAILLELQAIRKLLEKAEEQTRSRLK